MDKKSYPNNLEGALMILQSLAIWLDRGGLTLQGDTFRIQSEYLGISTDAIVVNAVRSLFRDLIAQGIIPDESEWALFEMTEKHLDRP